MKMLKKLLAVVLTGAMALTLFTACGSNAVRDKDIADALNNIVKLNDSEVTFTPRAKEREMAQKVAALLESHSEDDSNSAELSAKIQGILGIDQGGVNENNFVWVQNALTDKLGAEGQAFQVMESLTDKVVHTTFRTWAARSPQTPATWALRFARYPIRKTIW